MRPRVRRCLQCYAAAWAGFGLATAIAVTGHVNADAVVIVIDVAILSSTAALTAVALFGRVSTLRQYLEGLGARLELVAVFEDEGRRVPVHLGRWSAA